MAGKWDQYITVDHKGSSWLLTESDVAKMLAVSLAALRRWRIENRGPVCIKIGALVRYRPRDVENWLKSRPVRGERIAAHSTAGRTSQKGSSGKPPKP